MKKLTATLVALSFTLYSIAQVITIDVKEARTHMSLGEVEFQSVIDAPDVEDFSREVNCRYVIDLGDSISTFYRAGSFVSEVKIEPVEVSPGVYSITCHDRDNKTGQVYFKTSLMLDTRGGKEKFFYQYYDRFSNQTVVDVLTDFVIVQPV